jgi:superfamily II DNA/RNA helicase
LSFHPLGLSDELLSAVNDSGYTEPTEIQRQAIPLVLMGRDVVGVAQTGTGKTASFVLPMIDILAQGRSRALMPRSLIIAPTRELADQVAQNFDKYGKNHKLTMALLIGGVGFADQDKLLKKGVDVLIATPGRLLDQFERGKILLSGVDILVIDEADRMLDMGFIPDVERICSLLGKNRQTLLFSATMPPPIKKLADNFMSSPKQIEVERQSSANANIEQNLVEVSPRGKRPALRKLLNQSEVISSIVFSNRKKDVRDLADMLAKEDFAVGQIHGDMEQRDRLATMERFKSGEINILVASDVAARGLDIKGVSHVINYDVPYHAEDYVHRIGRTGRAGATGVAYTLATERDREFIDAIEALLKTRIPRVGEDRPAAKAEEAGKTPKKADDDKPRRARKPSKVAEDDRAEEPEARSDDKPKRRRKPRRNDDDGDDRRDNDNASDDRASSKRATRDDRESGDRDSGDRDADDRREQKSRRPRANDRKPRAKEAREPDPDFEEPIAPDDAAEDWNGPIPGFLSR